MGLKLWKNIKEKYVSTKAFIFPIKMVVWYHVPFPYEFLQTKIIMYVASTTRRFRIIYLGEVA